MFESTIAPEKWAQAKQLFETTDLSAGKIGKQVGDLNRNSIITKARREGWKRPNADPERVLMQKAKAKLEIKLERKTERKAEQLTNRVAAAQERMISTVESWFEPVEAIRDQIMSQKETQGFIDPDTLAKGVGAMKTIIEMGRKVHGMDDNKATTHISLNYNIAEFRPESAPQINENPQVIEAEVIEQKPE